MILINYKSDFKALLKLRELTGKAVVPSWPWEAVFTTSAIGGEYVASFDGVAYHNCEVTAEGDILVTFDGHSLAPGALRVTFTARVPNASYPDGVEVLTMPTKVLGVELVRGATPTPNNIYLEAVLPTIKGDKCTLSDFTEEEYAALQSPATKAAEVCMAAEAQRVISEDSRSSAESIRSSSEASRSNAETSRASAETSRQSAETLRANAEASRISAEQNRVSAEISRANAEQTRKDAETLRVSAESSRSSAESDRVAAESGRVSKEAERVAAESARVQAEAEREVAMATAVSNAQNAVANFGKGIRSTSADISLSEEGMLALTDMAKKRLFDDIFAEMAGICGRVDHTHTENGKPAPYYLNGLWLTYEEAMLTYAYGNKYFSQMAPAYDDNVVRNLRTNFPQTNISVNSYVDLSQFYRYGDKLEVFVFGRHPDNAWYKVVQSNTANGVSGIFSDCPLLREVRGNISLVVSRVAGELFSNCPNLAEIRISGLGYNAVFNLPKLSLDSLKFIINNRLNTTPITITVHPDVYAKITDSTNTEWNALLTLGASKNISFAK